MNECLVSPRHSFIRSPHSLTAVTSYLHFETHPFPSGHLTSRAGAVTIERGALDGVLVWRAPPMGRIDLMMDEGRGLLWGWGPLVGLRVSASRYLWRPGPAWAVLAGAIASGAPLFNGEALLRLVGLALLADSAWGAVWAPIIGADPSVSPAAMPHRTTTSWPLPYMQRGAPADQLRGMASEARWHDLFVAALLTAGLAALLGLPALIISAAALGVTMWGLFVGQWEAQPALPRALLNVGLPWLLGLTLAERSPVGGGAVALAVLGLPVAALLLGAAFTLLEWGAQRAGGSHDSRARGVWLGQAAVLLVLIGLRLPWTTAVVAALLLPPAWLWLRFNSVAPGWGGVSIRVATLVHSAPWWWAALMLSALALR